MSRARIIRPPEPPAFNSLEFKVAIPRLLTLKDIAEIYSWCSVNCTDWNLLVTGTEMPSLVTFAFRNEIQALVFKLTWA